MIRSPLPGERRLRRWMALQGWTQPVVIYQMAKVGSSAVVHALERSGVAAFQVHRMSAEHLRRMRDERVARGWSVGPIPAHDRLGLELRRRLVASGRGDTFVTLVRDPIARNLSSYFEHLDAIWRTRNAHCAVPMADLCRGFFERFLHEETLTWFDDEIREVLGIDVYRQPFPREGHAELREGPFRLLVLKTEIGDEPKTGALQRFLSRRLAPVRRENRTDETPKGSVYREFRRTLRFPAAYVDGMLEARYTRHFYDESERAGMRSNYLANDD